MWLHNSNLVSAIIEIVKLHKITTANKWSKRTRN